MCVQSQLSPVKCLLSSILPKGKGVVFMLKLYADDSSDDATSLVNWSGYLMKEDQFGDLDEKIQKARGALPYFHMKEGHHLKHPRVYQKLVSLINPESVLCGISISFYRNEFDKLMSLKFSGQSLKYWFGTQTTYAVGSMMALCADWLNESEYRDELVSYMFENCPKQGDAEFFWGMLAKPQYRYRRDMYHYASHTFVDGKGPLGSVLQVCDILAWNLNNKEREKKNTRELNSLFKTPTIYRHHGVEEISKGINLSIDRWKLFDSKGTPYPPVQNAEE